MKDLIVTGIVEPIVEGSIPGPEGVLQKALAHYSEGTLTNPAFGDLPGAAGDYFSTPDSVDNSITQSMVIEADLAPDDWADPVNVQAVVAKWNTSANRSYQLAIGTDGRIRVLISDDGTAEILTQTVAGTGFAAGTRHTLQVEIDLIAGLVTIYADGDMLESPSPITATSIFDSLGPVEIGSFNNGTAVPFAGTIYSAQVIKGPTPYPYVLLDGVTGSYVNTPTQQVSTGDVEFVARIARNGPLPKTKTVMSQWEPAGGQRGWIFRTNANQTLEVILSPDGIDPGTSYESPSTYTFEIDEPYYIRARVRFSEGTVSFAESADGSDWNDLGLVALVETALFNTNAEIEVGSVNDGISSVFEGKVLLSSVYDDSGELVVNFGPQPYLQGDPGFIAPITGETWTLQGNAIATSYIDDGLKVEFDPEAYTGSSPFGTAPNGPWTINGLATVNDQVQWLNAGNGGSDYDLITGVGTVDNITIDGTVAPYPVPRSSGSAGLQTFAEQVIPQANTIFVVSGQDFASGLQMSIYDSKDGVTNRQQGIVTAAGVLEMNAGAALSQDGVPAFELARVQTHEYNGVSSEFTLSDSGVVVGNAGANSSGWGTVFSTGTGADGFQGYIAEIIIFNGLLDSTEKLIIQDYLDGKWIRRKSAYELISNALVRLDEKTIVSGTSVTAWENRGTGGAAYDLDTVVGTAANLTRMQNGWARLPGAVGDSFSTPDTPENSVTGSIQMDWFGSLDDWTAAANQFLISKWETAASNRAFRLGITSPGIITMTLSAPFGTGSVQANATVVTGLSAGEFAKITVRWDQGLQQATFLVNDVQLGAVVPLVVASIHDSGAPIEIGSHNNGANPMTGYCESAQVYDGANTPAVSYVDLGTGFVSTQSAVQLTSSIDIEAMIQLADYSTGFDQTIVSKEDSVTERAYRLTVGPVGEVILMLSPDGSDDSNFATFANPGFLDGITHSLNVQWIGGTATLTFDGVLVGTQPLAVAQIWPSSSDIEVGAKLNGLDLASGKIHFAQVAKVNGPIVAQMNPADYVSGSTWPSDTGEIWTLNGTASVSQFAATGQTLVVDFDPSLAEGSNATWTGIFDEVWAINGDAFVNTTGQDVVNSAGLVGIETALVQTLFAPMTIFIAGKTVTTGTVKTYQAAKASSVNSVDITHDNANNAVLNAGANLFFGGMDNEPHIVTAQYNGDPTSVFTVSGINSITGDAGAEPFNAFALFHNASDINHYIGWMGEYLLFDAALTETEVQTLQDYFENKWIT